MWTGNTFEIELFQKDVTIYIKQEKDIFVSLSSYRFSLT